ncbi:hypothetical protein [Streptomyces lydicus]|uniref:hypothetical protein n=1 Tax=Streptomyces lydicus TaxID=47763 RepID=UPI00378BC425
MTFDEGPSPRLRGTAADHEHRVRAAGTIPPRAASSDPFPPETRARGVTCEDAVDSPALTEVVAQDGVVLFDHLDAMLICAFKRENALCESDAGPNAPRQYGRRPG